MTTPLRHTIFWLLDFLNGSKVRKHYNSIKKVNEDHGSAFSVSKREKSLSEILKHASDTVPFYKDLGIGEIRLDQFPVTNKNLIRQDANSFLSSAYLDKKRFEATTSGSTGTPFTIIQDIDKKRRHTAAVHYFGETVGHRLGSKFFYLKIWNNKNKKGKLIRNIQNIVPIDVFQLDDQIIGALLKDIKASKTPKSILAYASALDNIVKYLERNPAPMLDAGVTSIIAMSEALEEHTKTSLKLAFGCPVVSRYANIENGILAQQTLSFEDDFLLNLACYHIEILDLDEDRPAREGTAGRIVVTDMFNRAMPMIRYDTGDLGIMGRIESNGKTHYVLKSIEGRKMDGIFNTDGTSISSFIITNSMWKYTELIQYQFIQLDQKKYEFRLNSEGDFEREKELVAEFKGYLGEDAEIKITHVEEIPLLSSGKRKKVLSKLNMVPVHYKK